MKAVVFILLISLGACSSTSPSLFTSKNVSSVVKIEEVDKQVQEIMTLP